MSEEAKKPAGRFQKKEPVAGSAGVQPPKTDDNTQKPPVPPTPPVEDEKEESGKIKSEAAALKLVKKNYKLPEGVNVAYVAEDANVFYNENNAMVHARQNRLKLFTVKP